MAMAVHIWRCNHVSHGYMGSVLHVIRFSRAFEDTNRLSIGYIALPDLPTNTRAFWLSEKERSLGLKRMQESGRELGEPITVKGIKRVLSKWHFWVYTAYYTWVPISDYNGYHTSCLLCDKGSLSAARILALTWIYGSRVLIGAFDFLPLIVSNNANFQRYTTPEINTYPTVINAITIVTTLLYGWTSDAIQMRSPIVYFSLTVCFFAAVNLAVWDGVPFGLKWASYYLTGYVVSYGRKNDFWQSFEDLHKALGQYSW